MSLINQILDPRLASASVIGRIEAVLEGVVDSLTNAQELQIQFNTRRASRSCTVNNLKYIRFPGRNARESRQFARVLLILQLSHQALLTGNILTKRHIFYQHQDLFDSQKTVDKIVDDLAYTLGTDRSDLGIGSVAGCIIITLHDGTVVDTSRTELGAPIPTSGSIKTIVVPEAKWLLVVEKDAVFRSLVASRFWQYSLAGQGIIVTAKGYPDLMTRSFLVKIEAECPLLPKFVLSDFDPDGLNIFLCYRHGTKNFSHESSNNEIHLSWLGVQSTHVLQARFTVPGLPDGGTAPTHTLPLEAFRELSVRDRKYAVSLLRGAQQSRLANSEMASMRPNLQTMLMLGVKAEIQAVDDFGDITNWLDAVLLEKLQS